MVQTKTAKAVFVLCYNKHMVIKEELRKLIDEEYRQFIYRIVKTNYQVLGIRLPKLREIAKKIAKEELAIINSITDDSFEEVMLQGFVIAYSKTEILEKEKAIRNYLKKVDNWSHVDSFAATFKITKKEIADYWQIIERIFKEEKALEYETRFALVACSNTFLNDEYIDQVLKYSSKQVDKANSIKMANGWLLATASINYLDKVKEILRYLDEDTYKIYKRKMMDSYRISKEKKELIKNGYERNS